MKRYVLILSVLFVLSGCSVLDKDLITQLAADHASFCMDVVVSGGGGAVTIAPLPVPGGAYGYGHGWVCRTNEPGSTIDLKPDGSLTIQHGKTEAR